MADNEELIKILESVCVALDSVGAIYAVTGSLASSAHGLPTSTLDADLCLKLSPTQAAALIEILPVRLYRNAEAIIEAAQTHGFANLIDQKTQLKIDLSILAPGPFYQSVLSRRIKIDYAANVPALWTVSPEDIILMKLLWRKDTHSQKQWENALSVVKVKMTRLDWSYLHRWAEQLGIKDQLEQLQSEGGI